MHDQTVQVNVQWARHTGRHTNPLTHTGNNPWNIPRKRISKHECRGKLIPFVFCLRYFLICVNYFFYGETVADYFGALVQREEPLQFLARYHRFISFALYLAGESHLLYLHKHTCSLALSLSLTFSLRGWIRFHKTQLLLSRVQLQITLLGKWIEQKQKQSSRETKLSSWYKQTKLIYSDTAFPLVPTFTHRTVYCCRMCRKSTNIEVWLLSACCLHTLWVKRNSN